MSSTEFCDDMIFDSNSEPEPEFNYNPTNPIDFKVFLRSLVRAVYSTQKLRIQVGNRTVAAFRSKLGLQPSQPESDNEDAQKILKMYRSSYQRITDGIKKDLIPRNIKIPDGEMISHFVELCLVQQYDDLLRDEEKHFKMLAKNLVEFPIYNKFLEPTKGVGPALASIIISEIDITKAKYSSSLWKYAGLDVVRQYKLEEKFSSEAPEFLNDRNPDGYLTDPPGFESESFLLKNLNGTTLGAYSLTGKARSKRKEHQIEVEYTKKDGTQDTRMSITFNPFLRTKILGVLGPSFLKCKNEKYAGIYYDYRNRLNHRKDLSELTDKHKHNMAIRYMVKMYFIELYENWRPLEGLEVFRPYHEAKLGLIHTPQISRGKVLPVI